MRIFVTFTVLFIINLSFGQNANIDNDKKLILGKWISSDDKKYKIVFTDSTVVEYYGREKTETYNYKIEKDRLTKIDQDGNVYEYDIMGLSKKYLTLMYLTRGNILMFQKNPNGR